MPLETINNDFTDISLSFRAHPITSDLIALKGVTSINRSLRNLILTINGERPFNSLLGSSVNVSLFESLDVRLTTQIEDQIRNVITNFEPRVSLSSVNVTPDFDQNGYHVLIDYTILGSDLPPQQVNFILQTVR